MIEIKIGGKGTVTSKQDSPEARPVVEQPTSEEEKE